MSPYLIILSVDQSQLEFEFCGINGEHPGATLSVQAVDVVPLHSGNVNWQVQGADNSMIPIANTQHTCDMHISTTQLYNYILCPPKRLNTLLF